ncbi:MAG: HEAT repeat domain-containing protein [Planctomycetes bacterium]|nr:HEAT repeat domain-containing protein [Planctomycetota bacterium]
MRVLPCFAVLLSLVGSVLAGEKGPREILPFRDTAEYWVVREADGFWTEPVGDGATDLPLPILAWRMLAARSDAKEAFAALLNEAGPSGKLYALSGLWIADPRACKLALPKLLPLLAHKDPRVRRWCLSALAWGGVEALEQEVQVVVPSVAKLLRDPHPRVRAQALRVLGYFGPWAGRARSAIWTELSLIPAELRPEEEDEEEEEEEEDAWDRCEQLVRLLGRIRPPALLEARQLLRHPNPRLAARAVGILSARGPTPALGQELMELLKAPRAAVRFAALQGLMELGERLPSAALAPLEGLLGSQEVDTRELAAMALGAAGPKAKGAIGALGKCLGDPAGSVRIEAAAALWSISRRAEGIPVLARAAATGGWRTRLDEIAQTPEGRRALIVFVARPDTSSAHATQVLYAIGNAGAEAKDVLPALRRLSLVPGAIQLPAAWARHKLTREFAPLLAAHRARLRGEDVEQICASAKALCRFGKRAGPALGDLVAAFDRAPARLAGPIGDLCQKLGPAATKAVPVLIRCLYLKKRGDRARACEALEAIGAEARLALPRLFVLAELKEKDDRWCAFRATRAIKAIKEDLERVSPR